MRIGRDSFPRRARTNSLFLWTGPLVCPGNIPILSFWYYVLWVLYRVLGECHYHCSPFLFFYLLFLCETEILWLLGSTPQTVHSVYNSIINSVIKNRKYKNRKKDKQFNAPGAPQRIGYAAQNDQNLHNETTTSSNRGLLSSLPVTKRPKPVQMRQT